MSAELVKRLREYGDDPQDVSLGEIAEWMHKSSDRIEQLERENRELKMQSLSDDAQYQMLAEELAAEKALADQGKEAVQHWVDHSHHPCQLSDEFLSAYRKARGL